MKKLLLFIILEQYADWEAAYLSSAVRMLVPEVFDIKTVSIKRGLVESIGGFRTQADYDLQTMPEHYEAMFLIGGMTWRTEEAREVVPFIQACAEKGKLLGGICDAAGFLSTAGLLNDVRHTGNGLENLQQWAGGTYTGAANYVLEPAVCDGKILTANGTAPLEFAKEALFALGVEQDKVLEWYNFHKLGMYRAPVPNI